VRLHPEPNPTRDAGLNRSAGVFHRRNALPLGA
jgi:hypothetical protein